MKVIDLIKNRNIIDIDNFSVLLIDYSGNKYNLDYFFDFEKGEVLLRLNV